MKTNKLKQKLKQGGVAIGVTVNWPSAGIAEFLGYMGFDAVVVDAEHGSVTDEQFEQIARACDSTNICPIIRLPLNPQRLSRYFDIGAQAVQAPMISSFEEAKEVINAVKFPPVGQRGLGRTRAAKYGLMEGGLPAFPELSNKETLIMVQIENLSAFESLPEILKLEEIDVILIGTLDLSQSLGITGKLKDNRILDLVEKIIFQTNSAGKTAALPAATYDDVKNGIKQGARYFLTSVSGFVSEGGKSILRAIIE